MMILRPASRAIVVFLFDLVRFFPMSGQSDRRQPTYLASDLFHSDAIDGEVAEGRAILPMTANLLPGARPRSAPVKHWLPLFDERPRRFLEVFAVCRLLLH